MAAAAQKQMARQGAGLTAGMLIQMAVAAIVFVTLGAVALDGVTTTALELGGPSVRERAPDL